LAKSFKREITRLASENNRYQTDFESLYQSALEKVKDHVTDLAEIQRVLGKK
jgi:protein transport protein HofB